MAGGESSKRRALKDKAREITEGSHCKDFGLPFEGGGSRGMMI